MKQRLLSIISMVSIAGIAAACAACGSSPSETSTGGAGGSGVTTTSTTTTTTTTTTTSTTTTCPTSGENVYDNSSALAPPACDSPVAPLPNEDGTFAVTVFGPFPKAFVLEGVTFLTAEEDNAGVSDPWTVAAIVVPAGGDPLAVDPSASAQPYPLTTLDSIPSGPNTYHLYSIQLDAPLPVGACERVVIALRNTVGPPRSTIMMCGTTGSAHPETNQWWNLDGTMTEMSTYGSNFDRDWGVSLMPAAP